jgi:hypothetical protein
MTVKRRAIRERQPEPSPQCPHCQHLPDSVAVLSKVTYYEHHSIDCPLLAEVIR